MSAITISSKGEFTSTFKFLEGTKKMFNKSIFNKYGVQGVKALQKATPKRTGKTAESWSYEVVMKTNGVSIIWKNSNTNQGVPIAVLIQYGHGTGWGGYVQGVDYINPALTPIFNDIVKELWKEVVK